MIRSFALLRVRGGRSGGQQVARRQHVGRVAGGLAHRQAQLLADTVAARLGRRGGRHGRSGAAGPRGWLLGRARPRGAGGSAASAGGSAKAACRRRLGRRRAGSAAGSSSPGSSGEVVDVRRARRPRRHRAAGEAAEQVGELAQRRVDEQEEGVPRQEQQHGHRDPHGEPGGQRDRGEVADGPATLVPALRLGGQARGDVHQAQRAQREERRADHQPRPGLGVRLGGHEHDADDEQQHRHHLRAEPDDRGQRVGERLPDRTTRARPHAGADDDGQHEDQHAQPAPAVYGIDLAGAADPATHALPGPRDAATDTVDRAVEQVRVAPRAPCGRPPGGGLAGSGLAGRPPRRPGPRGAAACRRASCHAPQAIGRLLPGPVPTHLPGRAAGSADRWDGMNGTGGAGAAACGATGTDQPAAATAGEGRQADEQHRGGAGAEAGSRRPGARHRDHADDRHGHRADGRRQQAAGQHGRGPGPARRVAGRAHPRGRRRAVRWPARRPRPRRAPARVRSRRRAGGRPGPRPGARSARG